MLEWAGSQWSVGREKSERLWDCSSFPATACHPDCTGGESASERKTGRWKGARKETYMYTHNYTCMYTHKDTAR